MTSYREARVKAGLTYRAAATALGTSTAYLCGVEAGKTSPGASVLVRMADLYGVSLDDLVGRKPPQGYCCKKHKVKPSAHDGKSA